MGLIYEKKDHIAFLTMNRPEAMNAMDPDMYQRISEAWVDFRDDPDMWVAVITGAGDRAFSAGADLKTNFGRMSPSEAYFIRPPFPILNRGLDVFKPVIAAVNGYCLGGGLTLLFACDIRVAAEHATFGLSEVKRGILPGNGGTQRAIRQLPYPLAMELLLIGDRIDAQAAYRLGMLNKIVPKEELMPTALDYARRLLDCPPLAVRAIKEAAIKGYDLTLNEGIKLEGFLGSLLQETEDAVEGREAFKAKRKPVWKGR
ncbi:MAG: enoyl-CoA hydratase/isomerase family protein [Chloroflexi bacterium]|nr:enoyl-CoA hydratase/isomerase family protein [Chloroflexota bacterium]